MLFDNVVRRVKETLESLSGFSASYGRSRESVHGLDDQASAIQSSCWANLPPDILYDIMRRLEESGITCPSHKDLVVFAAVCRSWRQSCKDIVRGPEIDGKLILTASLKQPGPRNGMMQCFIKEDIKEHIYQLYMGSDALVENGKFLLAAKGSRKGGRSEYVISMDAENISNSSKSYVGKIRSNSLTTKFIIYDTQPRYNSGRVSPKQPKGSYNIGQVMYQPNVLGVRMLGRRRMNCVMNSIPAKSSSAFNHSIGIRSVGFCEDDAENGTDGAPLVLRNSTPMWDEQLQCWARNFQGRVTMVSKKNFQLVASCPAEGVWVNLQAPQSRATEHEKVILQLGKVGKNIFNMDYRYPLSAFQAFAICLTRFDTKVACV